MAGFKGEFMLSLEGKCEMPLIAAMLRYKKENIYPLHTPGHKGGRGMEKLLQNELSESVKMDVSLMSELDDLHAPSGCIKKAEELAAGVYGSDLCLWAVNGTTGAIHAMLLTALNPGEKLLLPRNAHRSVAGGLILGGINSAYLTPGYDSGFGLQLEVRPEQIAAALDKDKEIKAVLLTSPNYYGIAADVKSIAAICHERGVVLLVDEAHGAHLGFSKLLPPSALHSGADASAQSTHKLLGAMTQCSMLHVQGKRLDLARARDAMSLLTTTSPDYLLMASLDAARAQLAAYGREMAEAAVSVAAELRQLCAEFKGLRVLEKKDLHGFDLDTTKVTVNFAALGYSGVEAGELLRKNRIAVELVDAANVLFLVTYADKNKDFPAALGRIREVFAFMEKNKRPPLKQAAATAVPVTNTALAMRDVFYSAKKSLPLKDSEGAVCGEQVAFYPPGIPVLLPGEIITREIIAYCLTMRELGLPVSGPADTALKRIRVADL